MLVLKKFTNQLMSSNCFIIYDDETNRCVIVDPGSRDSNNEILFIKDKNLTPDFVILTHEHSDHTWGVNSLLDCFKSLKVIASVECERELPFAGDMYFRLYFDDLDYHYEVRKVDIPVLNPTHQVNWSNHKIKFYKTPGHSIGSMSILIGKFLFTGDTIMNYKNYFSKRSGSKTELIASQNLLKEHFAGCDITICPGHGDLIYNYFKEIDG